jgi:hypothetical protein
MPKFALQVCFSMLWLLMFGAIMALPNGHAADMLIKPGTTASPQAGKSMYLQTPDNYLVPAVACMATDGSSNLIPMPGGGGGGGTVNQGTPGASAWPVSLSSVPLASGAATSANQSTANSSLSTLVSQTVGLATSALQSAGNSTLGTISSTLSSILSAVTGTLSVSGTFWQATQPVSLASVPLASGAATAANQSTANSSLATIVSQTVGLATAAVQSTISSTLNSILSALSGTLTVGGTVAVSNFPATQPVSGTVTTVQTPNPNTVGSVSNNSVGTSAVLVTAPASSMKVTIESESGNTANCRWAIGATASASVGTLMEPGRSFENLDSGASVSIYCLAAAQNVSVQWFGH